MSTGHLSKFNLTLTPGKNEKILTLNQAFRQLAEATLN